MIYLEITTQRHRTNGGDFYEEGCYTVTSTEEQTPYCKTGDLQVALRAVRDLAKKRGEKVKIVPGHFRGLQIITPDYKPLVAVANNLRLMIGAIN